eukprot:7428865-Lingulodinium_polyedra.AAC.1
MTRREHGCDCNWSREARQELSVPGTVIGTPLPRDSVPTDDLNLIGPAAARAKTTWMQSQRLLSIPAHGTLEPSFCSDVPYYLGDLSCGNLWQPMLSSDSSVEHRWTSLEARC